VGRRSVTGSGAGTLETVPTGHLFLWRKKGNKQSRDIPPYLARQLSESELLSQGSRETPL
jgi:hypothetical protein